ncbi:MAG TPA: RICIN domain-containing protein [Labilithrix sp.]|nr:RICIN domain-containing protein [Labilithrix sp.]
MRRWDLPSGPPAVGVDCSLRACNSLGRCVSAEVKPTDCASEGGCVVDGDDSPTKFVDEAVDAGEEVDAADAGVVDAADAGNGEDAGLVVVSYRAGPKTTKCMAVSGGSTENGNKVVLWDCNGEPSQGWGVMADGTIRSAMDLTKCLHAPNTTNGTQLQIWDCNGEPSQSWVPMPDNTIRYAADTNRCVDLRASNILSNNPIDIYACNGGQNQVSSLTVTSTHGWPTPSANANARLLQRRELVGERLSLGREQLANGFTTRRSNPVWLP